MALPSTRAELTPQIIANELFGEAADGITRVKTIHELSSLLGCEKQRRIANIAFNIANGRDDITQNGTHPENLIEPLTQAIIDSKILRDNHLYLVK